LSFLLVKGELALFEVCREHDLKQSEVDSWMETFSKAGPHRRSQHHAVLS
jgi:hypothetical protein